MCLLALLIGPVIGSLDNDNGHRWTRTGCLVHRIDGEPPEAV
jgi:hypothetical protein